MRSFGTPNKLKSLYSDSSHNTNSLSAHRHQRSVNDRDRRRQIIAKLAQKRKQYQRGIGTAERESFRQRVNTSIIKHKEKEKLQTGPIKVVPQTKIITDENNGYQEVNKDENKEEEEHKSVSISRSLSISPIQSLPSSSISSSNSSSCLPSHHNDTDDDDTLLYDEDIRHEEIQMLRAQNKRLSNKLEHVNSELVETNVFLRSERKRNKHIFNELKVKEEQVTDLTQHIDELETEIEEKDKKCIECVERLSKAEQETNAINTNLSNKIKQNYKDIKEWQNKYYDIFEKYSSIQSQHKQDIEVLEDELNQRNILETENVHKFNQVNELMNVQNVEMMKRKQENDTWMNSIHDIIKTLKYEIKYNPSNEDHSVSKQLNAMLSKDLESNDSLCSEAQTEINVLLQLLIGVIEKSDQQKHHNHELTLCLTKYEKDIETSKCTMIEYQNALKHQQDQVQKLQENYTCLTEEKIQVEHKANQMYETVLAATSKLQDIVTQITNKKDIGDININQCAEIIADSLQNKENNIKRLLQQVTTKYLHQMDAVAQIFRNVSGDWSQRIDGLQDRLSMVQIHLLHTYGTNACNYSNMSMVSDLHKSFRVDDIELQCSEQMQVIHELKDELRNKQKTIETLVQKSDDIQQSKFDKIRKERDDAISDFRRIAQEWQHMEEQIETTYNNNELLRKQTNDIQYWINHMVQYVNEHMNGRQCNSESFESILNDIPKPLRELHASLMHISMRMNLNALNETTCNDIDDDAVLYQLFGKIEANEDTSAVAQVAADSIKKGELENTIHKMEAEICLENIIHKVELSHIGNEAEKLIVAYQERLKTYARFIRELQHKISQSSKLVHSISLERDHAWSQYQGSEKEANKLKTQNRELSTKVADVQKQLECITQQYNEYKRKVEIKMESNARQMQSDETTNMDLHKRLHESTQVMHEITTHKEKLEEINTDLQQRLQETTESIQQVVMQRDELQAAFMDTSKKFIAYKDNCDVLFKRSCDAMVEEMNPLIMKLNQYLPLNERMENMTQKVKCLKDHFNEKRKRNAKDELKIKCEESAISKLRIHADIHRFHFAKLLHEMKQKYEIHIEELQERIASSQNQYTQIETECDQLNNQKMTLQSQLIQIKKSFNEEIVNYQHVQSQNKQQEMELNEIINNLQQELVEKNKYADKIVHENQITATKRESVQEKLNQQTKKTKKLHSKAIKLQNELKNAKSKYNQMQQTLINLESGNNDYMTQITQLQDLNESLKDTIHTKEVNHQKMAEMYIAECESLKEALVSVETVNNALNDKCETQQNELKACMQQLERAQISNQEALHKLENMKNKGSQEEQEWLNKEEDLRNEIHLIRRQLHETTNDLGSMKLETLEKDTLLKKVRNEINALNEEILFYKEREQKEMKEKEELTQQIAQANKSNEQRVNDIKMIMDAKAVRILQLDEDLMTKANAVKELQCKLIEIQNEKSGIQDANNKLNEKNNENNKLQMRTKDLANQLNKMKKDLETQKNANVQLSMELDAIKQNKVESESELEHNVDNMTTNDILNRYSSLSFFDEDLEKSQSLTSCSMPNLNANQNDEISNYSENNMNESNKSRRKPKLPIPKSGEVPSSSKSQNRRNKNSSCRSLYGHNAEI